MIYSLLSIIFLALALNTFSKKIIISKTFKSGKRFQCDISPILCIISLTAALFINGYVNHKKGYNQAVNDFKIEAEKALLEERKKTNFTP